MAVNQPNPNRHISPTEGYFPQRYLGRRLVKGAHQWPSANVEILHNNKIKLRRTNEGLEAVPGYFQNREMGPPGQKKNMRVYVEAFQRRRGVGLDRVNHHQIPLSDNFLNSYTNNQLYEMRRQRGMFNLLFWDHKKYTAQQAYQWNRYLDEHPQQQHLLPIPRSPQDALPPPPVAHHEYPVPDYNRKTHEYHWNKDNGMKIRRRQWNDDEDEINPNDDRNDDGDHGGGEGYEDDDQSVNSDVSFISNYSRSSNSTSSTDRRFNSRLNMQAQAAANAKNMQRGYANIQQRFGGGTH